MENKTYGESNYPSGTWENIWINLISKIIEEIRRRKYMVSWRTTEELFSWLPEECKKDVKPDMDAIMATFKKAGVSEWALIKAEYGPSGIPEYELYRALLDLHAKIRYSLEDHGWICKPVGATPQVKHKKEAWA